jgi:peptidoglycan/LPS O-acetylase OafA/YrhL
MFHSDGIIFDMRTGFWENKPPKIKSRFKLIPDQIHGPAIKSGVSQGKIHLSFLDGIRGLAILAVFLIHSLGASFGLYSLGWSGLFRDFHVSKAYLALYPLTYGWVGVPIFFVVSGFCIHLSHQSSRETGWLGFINRRFFRIYPAYLLAVCVFFFVWPATQSVHSAAGHRQLAFHLLAVHNLGDDTYFGINGSFWSIAVEIQLYAIYPILLLVTRKFGWGKALLFVGIVEMTIHAVQEISLNCFDHSLRRHIIGSPFAFWFSWAIGAYVAQCFLDGKVNSLLRFRFDLMIVIAFAMPLFKPTDEFAFPAFSFAAAIAIDRLISKQWKLPDNRIFSIAWRHLGLLGMISYSFYLFHQPIVHFFSDHVEHLPPWARFCICCSSYVIIFALSYLIYRLVEQPSTALGKWASQRASKKFPTA